MNLIELVVTEVIGKPYESHGLWIVDVMADSWGSIQPTRVYCKSEDEANNVAVGFKFFG